MPVYFRVDGIDPEDLPTVEETDGKPVHKEMQDDLYERACDEFGDEIEGAVAVVNPDVHERLAEANGCTEQ